LNLADAASTLGGGLVGLAGLGLKGAANIDDILATAFKGQNKETYSKFFKDFGELSSAVGTAGSEYVTGGGLEESYKSGELFRNISTIALETLMGTGAVKGGLKLADIGSKTVIKKAADKALASATKPLRNQRGMIGEIDLDAALRLPLKDRIELAMKIENIPASKTKEMTEATKKLIGDAKDPTKDILKDVPKGPAEEIIDLNKLIETGQAKEIALSQGRKLDNKKVFYHGITEGNVAKLEPLNPSHGGSIFTTGDLGLAASHSYSGANPIVKQFTIDSKNSLDWFSEVTESHKDLLTRNLKKYTGGEDVGDIFKDVKKWWEVDKAIDGAGIPRDKKVFGNLIKDSGFDSILSGADDINPIVLDPDIIKYKKDLKGYKAIQSALDAQRAAKEIVPNKGNFVDVIKNLDEDFPLQQLGHHAGGVSELVNDLTQNPKLAKSMAKFIGEDVELLDAGAEAVVFSNKKRDYVYRMGLDEVQSQHGGSNLKDLPGFAENVHSKVIGKYHVSKNKFVEEVGKIPSTTFEKEFEKLPNVVRDPYNSAGYLTKNTKTGDWYNLDDLHSKNFGRDKKTGKIKIIDPGVYNKADKKLDRDLISEYEDILRDKPKTQRRMIDIQSALTERYGKSVRDIGGGALQVEGQPHLPFGYDNVSTKEGLASLMDTLDSALEVKKDVPAFAGGGPVSKFTDFMVGKLKPFFGTSEIPDIDIDREVDADKFPGQAGSYLRSKETTKKLLDDAGKFGKGGMARRRRHFAAGGESNPLVSKGGIGGAIANFKDKNKDAWWYDFMFKPAKDYVTTSASDVYKQATKTLTPGNIAIPVGLMRALEVDPEVVDPKTLKLLSPFLRDRLPRRHSAEGGFVEEDENQYRQAIFAEETASIASRRFAREATELHRSRQRLSEEEIKAAEEAKYQRQRRREIAQTETVERLLRRPGVDTRPGDDAAREVYGLKKLEFDKRRGVVSFDSLPGGRISQYDLNEIKYQDLKRDIESGKINKPTVEAGFRATAGDDPRVKAQIEQAKKDREELDPLWSVQPGSRQFQSAGQLYGREAELVLPIWRSLLNHEFDDNPEIQEYRDRTKELMGSIDTGERLSPDDVKYLSKLVKADKEGLFLSGSKPTFSSETSKKAVEKAKAAQELDRVYEIARKLEVDPETAAKLLKASKTSGRGLTEKDTGPQGSFLDSVLRIVAPGVQIARDLMKLRDKTEEKSAGALTEDKTKKELEKFSLDAFLKKPTPAVQLLKDTFGKANGGSIPFFQSGGAIGQCGS